MTKVCVITDTHAGCRSDQVSFFQHMHWFYQHVFFPTLEERNIKIVFHLGDLLDRRKYINFQTLSRLKSDFLDEIRDRKLDFHILSGNHDIYGKNLLKFNGLEQVLEPYPFHVYTKPQILRLKGISRPIAVIPWIMDETRQQASETLLDAPSSAIVFGHLELKGFTMNPGSISEHGDDVSTYRRFAGVYSGHYHSISHNENIHYLGAPFHFNWGDYNDPRGFHILDTETLELEFFENPYSMFRQVEYDEDDESLAEQIEQGYFMNCYTKVIVKNKHSQAKFEEFLSKIDAKFPLDLKIVETARLAVDKGDFTGAETTPEIIRKYVGAMESPMKLNIENKLISYYEKALMSD